ncbi:MAG: sigma-70 family RNA polymerase sigma factor, partial [Planctomycetes bacterium]|nr:sigma-70 family RNA polymerase sigma factor [Planctomycetota bacterium]
MDAHLEDLIDHADWVRGLAESLILDQVEVDDVVQQTWLSAIERASPRRVASPRAWLAAAVRNVALQMGRSERRRRRALPTTSLDPATLQDRASDHLELHRRLVTAVESLGETDRALIVMRYFEGRQPRDMASDLQLPVTTVRNRLARALERLRTRLDRESGGRRAWSLALVGILAGRMPSGAPRWPGATGRLTVGRIAAMIVVATTCLVIGSGGQDLASSALEPAVAESTSDAFAARRLARSQDLHADRRDTLPSRPASNQESEAQRVVTIRGRVQSEDGRPIGGAVIRIVDAEESSSVALDEMTKFERRLAQDPVLAATQSAASGRFEVVVDRVAAYRIIVRAKGHTLVSRTVREEVPGAGIELDLRLLPVPVITCVVK